MTKRKLRILFSTIIVFLFIQFVVTLKFSEPYPAIIYPSFAHVGDNSKFNSYRIIEINIKFIDGTTILDDNKILRNFNPSVKRKILNEFFIAENSIHITKEKYDNFLVFLDKEIRSLYGKKAEHVEVSWYKVREFHRAKPIVTERKKYKYGILRF